MTQGPEPAAFWIVRSMFRLKRLERQHQEPLRSGLPGRVSIACLPREPTRRPREGSNEMVLGIQRVPLRDILSNLEAAAPMLRQDSVPAFPKAVSAVPRKVGTSHHRPAALPTPSLRLARPRRATFGNVASRRDRRVLAPSHAPFCGAERTSGRHV